MVRPLRLRRGACPAFSGNQVGSRRGSPNFAVAGALTRERAAGHESDLSVVSDSLCENAKARRLQLRRAAAAAQPRSRVQSHRSGFGSVRGQLWRFRNQEDAGRRTRRTRRLVRLAACSASCGHHQVSDRIAWNFVRADQVRSDSRGARVRNEESQYGDEEGQCGEDDATGRHTERIRSNSPAVNRDTAWLWHFA